MYKLKLKYSKQMNLTEILDKLGLQYGRYNESNVLFPNEFGPLIIIYNPNFIGRGITLTNDADREYIVISCYKLTSLNEIDCYFNLVEMMCNEYGSILHDENKNELLHTVNIKKELIENLPIEFDKFNSSPSSLQLAMNNYNFTTEDLNSIKSLEEFSKFINEVQKNKYYYANPRMYLKNNETIALYVLTEECVSIFPLKGDSSLAIDRPLDKILISFYFFEKGSLYEKLYDYNTFINVVKENCVLYDRLHIVIPSLSQQQILSIVNELDVIEI